MRKISYTNQFKRDYKSVVKRGYNIKKLEAILNLLMNDISLPQINRDHQLVNSKEHNNVREYHISPDWLLIYRRTKEEVQLIRTGTHSDLFC